VSNHAQPLPTERRSVTIEIMERPVAVRLTPVICRQRGVGRFGLLFNRETPGNGCCPQRNGRSAAGTSG